MYVHTEKRQRKIAAVCAEHCSLWMLHRALWNTCGCHFQCWRRMSLFLNGTAKRKGISGALCWQQWSCWALSWVCPSAGARAEPAALVPAPHRHGGCTPSTNILWPSSCDFAVNDVWASLIFLSVFCCLFVLYCRNWKKFFFWRCAT